MKKILIAMCAFMASVTVFAQVDSTSMRTDTTSTTVDTTATAPADTTSQSTISSDTTAAGSTTDSTSVGATDTTSVGSTGEVQITDEDLKKYAIVMDSVDAMKQALLTEISTKIKSNGKMKIARYNQLSKAVDDEAKLKELKATQEEIAFVKEVADLKKSGAQKISDNVESLATDFVGTDKYNKIKNSLDLDTTMRTRYEKIKSEMATEDSANAGQKPKTSN
jgi:hypothetical protein